MARSAVIWVVSAGGGLGALARWALAGVIPHHSGEWPTSTIVTNISGCAAIGVLMVVVEARPGHQLLRTFVGVGVLGGFTTFSTYAVDIGQLMSHHEYWSALAYLVLTMIGALAATTFAATVTSAALHLRRPQ